MRARRIILSRKSVDEMRKHLKGVSGMPKLEIGRKKMPTLVELELDAIEVEKQARLAFDEIDIANLAESIKQVGLLAPVIVRPKEGTLTTYKLISGERRFRASKLLGIGSIPAIVLDKDKSINEYLVQLYENIHRKDLHVIEKINGVTHYVISELEKNEDLKVGADVKALIRQVVNKLSFQRELSKDEKIIANTLASLKVPTDTLKLWFMAAAYSEEMQRFFIANRVPLRTIRKFVNSVNLPDQELKTLFQKEMDEAAEPASAPGLGRISITIDKTHKSMQAVIQQISSQTNLPRFKQKKSFMERIEELLRLADELKKLVH